MTTTSSPHQLAASKVDWVNGHTVFQELSTNEIKDLWFERRPAHGSTHVYIHGPFCAQLCSFCMHQGLKAGGRRDAIQEYYKRYLPAHLADFSDVLSSSRIDAIYFGGGTADIMPAEDMPKIFSAIPNFRKVACKVFEAHPATFSEKQMEQITLHEFTGGYVSFGLQTFDRDLCAREHRIYASPEKLRGKVAFLQNAGISVNVDLVAFLSSPDVASLRLLAHDLAILTEQVAPDTITIYPLRQAFNFEHQLTQVIKAHGQALDALNAHRIDLATALQDVVDKLCTRSKCYHQWKAPEDRVTDGQDDTKSSFMRPTYLTRLSTHQTDKIRSYNSGTPPFHNKSRSVIGFGNYGRIYSHSYITDEIAYYTMNDDWMTRYFVVHDKRSPELNLDEKGWEVADL
jgi:hypothetical protein